MSAREQPREREHNPDSLLPLTPVVLNILLALVDEARHGYGIMLEVREQTKGKVQLGPGTLYGAIRRLKEGGVIEEVEERLDLDVDDERRRYYQLTGFGSKVLSAEFERLDSLLRAARQKGVYPIPEGA